MPNKEPIPFWKMSGSGNDFVVVDNRGGALASADAPAFTRAVCRRRISVGADGVVLIEETTEAGVHFRWRYLNADGSDGEMCGNGAMCGARFAVCNAIAPLRCVFRTASGLVHAEVEPASPAVRIAVADPGPITRDLAVTVADRPLRLHAVAVGVPHAVAIVDDVDAFAPGDDLLAIGRAVRHHPRFAPAGTNLDVVAVRDRRTLRMRTYERGVEAETLACGTGAVASAIVATALALAEPPVAVITTGGRMLTVTFAWDGERATSVTLGGEARVIVRGTIEPEAFR